jgi:hypothetical protein
VGYKTTHHLAEECLGCAKALVQCTDAVKSDEPKAPMRTYHLTRSLLVSGHQTVWYPSDRYQLQTRLANSERSPRCCDRFMQCQESTSSVVIGEITHQACLQTCSSSACKTLSVSLAPNYYWQCQTFALIFTVWLVLTLRLNRMSPSNNTEFWETIARCDRRALRGIA